MFHGHLDYFRKPTLGGSLDTKPGDHDTMNAHNHWFILFYHVWGSTYIEIHWNSIWLRAWSHLASQSTWGSGTTLHDYGGVLGWPLDTFFWALTISRSWLLARVWSGPKLLKFDGDLQHLKIEKKSGVTGLQRGNGPHPAFRRAPRSLPRCEATLKQVTDRYGDQDQLWPNCIRSLGESRTWSSWLAIASIDCGQGASDALFSSPFLQGTTAS